MENESKNSYELKKQEREREREEESKKAKMAKAGQSFKWYFILTIIIIALGYGLILLVKQNAPKGEDFSIGYEDQGVEHIDNGSSHPSYNSNPPSSGWHYGSPARGGFYNEALPDEQVIHNLEHGDIWIAYHPDISDEAKDTLKSFAGQYIVVSPRVENDGDISLVAWGRVDTFNIENGIVNKERIKDFIKRYDNRGPEKVRSVQHIR